MPEREMVSVPKEYVEALESEHVRAEPIVERLYVGPERDLREQSDAHRTAWKNAENAKPKPPDAIDVLRRLARFGDAGRVFTSEDVLSLITDARRIIEAHDAGQDRDGRQDP